MTTILNIGQCQIDGPRMARLFREKLKANVLEADDAPSAIQMLENEPVNLVLVNRELAIGGESGVNVIAELRLAGCKTPVMLVSDHADAQDQAVRKGAMKGFGKSSLEDLATLDLIRQAASRNES
jgi:CheY-like chemotaxis protein